jgi:uncharacterized protein (TIGR01777 family)
MRTLVTGSTGLIGRALVSSLIAKDDDVVRLVRSKPVRESEVYWDPARGEIDRSGLEALHQVVHLAGESIAAGRWNEQTKANIRDSRVTGTRLLSEALAGLGSPPAVMVCASAVGFYGDRGDEVMTEDSGPGSGFLAEVCRDWEAATEAASRSGIRVTNLRIGMVLSFPGGALEKMLPPFKMGLGGKIGSGEQYMSWIELSDLVAVIRYALSDSSLTGPVNAVSPVAVTNLEFTKALGRVLGRPTVFPMPAFAARLAFGEMADELILASTRAKPAKLLSAGFSFTFSDLEDALRVLLKKT